MLAERGGGGSVSRVVRVDIVHFSTLCSGKYNRRDIHCTVYCTAPILSGTGGIYPLHQNDAVVEVWGISMQ